MINTHRSFFKASAYSFLIRIIGAISAFCFNLVIARTLNINDAGAFFLSFSIVMVLWSISSLGMPMAMVRFVGGYFSKENWGEINAILSQAIGRILIASVIVGLSVIFLIDEIALHLPKTNDLSPILKIMVFAIPAIAIYNIIAFAFQGIHKPIYSILLQNILTPLLTCLILILMMSWVYPVNKLTVTIVFTLSSIVTFLISLYLWFRQSNFKFKIKYTKNPSFLKSSHSLFTTNFMGLLVQWSGVLIVGAFVSEESVALFSVSQRIAMLTSFVLIAVNLVAAPRFAASFENGNFDELKDTAIYCNRIMLFSATPVLIIMLFFPGMFLGLFGEEYRQASYLLRILVIGQFVNVVTGSVGYLLNMTGHEKDMRNVVLLSGPLAVISGLILTPVYGVLGAAIATSLAVASQNIFAVFMVKKRLGFNTLKMF
jgi:O-antigen/teichoic acid export membrane protein